VEKHGKEGLKMTLTHVEIRWYDRGSYPGVTAAQMFRIGSIYDRDLAPWLKPIEASFTGGETDDGFQYLRFTVECTRPILVMDTIQAVQKCFGNRFPMIVMIGGRRIEEVISDLLLATEGTATALNRTKNWLKDPRIASIRLDLEVRVLGALTNS
jgi:hypothetical protein